MGKGIHVTLGPAIILYRSSTPAAARFTRSPPSPRPSRPPIAEGYGLFYGGEALDGAGQKYTYFLVRQDGTYLVKRRDGEKTTEITKGWVASAAVHKTDAKGPPPTCSRSTTSSDPSKVVLQVNGRAGLHAGREGRPTRTARGTAGEPQPRPAHRGIRRASLTICHEARSPRALAPGRGARGPRRSARRLPRRAPDARGCARAVGEPARPSASTAARRWLGEYPWRRSRLRRVRATLAERCAALDGAEPPEHGDAAPARRRCRARSRARPPAAVPGRPRATPRSPPPPRPASGGRGGAAPAAAAPRRHPRGSLRWPAPLPPARSRRHGSSAAPAPSIPAGWPSRPSSAAPCRISCGTGLASSGVTNG